MLTSTPVGIGGDYPLSSIITSEFATTKWRGAMMGSVFAMQGIGQFAAGIIALIVTSGFKESLLTASSVSQCSGVCQIAVDKMWRVIIGFGAVPGCIALYYRLTIPETPRYTFDVSRDVVKAGSDVKAYLSSKPEGIPDEITRVNTMRDAAPQMEIPKASWSDFWRHYSQWKYGKILLGTAGSWFFLDVAFYGVGLNNATILQAIGYANQLASQQANQLLQIRGLLIAQQNAMATKMQADADKEAQQAAAAAQLRQGSYRASPARTTGSADSWPVARTQALCASPPGATGAT